MIEVVVTAKRREADGIYSFELAAADQQPLPAFEAGAHIDVQLGDGQVRQYSLCNPPQERHRYLIGVLLDDASRGGSQALHQQVEAGSRLQIGEPRNLFPLVDNAGHSLLIAGGIGITPLLCMAERLAQSGAPFELHYCARSAQRAAFVERLRQSPYADRVQFHFSEEQGQRFDASALLAEAGADRHLYVCGPSGFIDYILGTAHSNGWRDEQLHREYFASSAPAAAGGAFEVQLASSGQCYWIPAERSVAEVLVEAGVDVPLSCEQGICGSCLTRVLEGEPEHHDLFMTAAEQARNDQFTPCCSRAKSARLVLDL
ncbi:MAG: PDR/VanB family oxidoreductase [Pseudomonas sp.]